ncbi:small-conductance mechanosensitive channel [Terribacillus sp. 179-K 1B1 HS]|uniref:small-conductance mechanosensitive channel n=1 Tax=Terribacillus sp. 179-K 1B1 HS TaxID=3142388 RepID=UPI0039A38246
MAKTAEQIAVQEQMIETQEQTFEAFQTNAHFWGRLTIGCVIVLSAALPLYLSFVEGYHPGWQAIFAAFVAYIALVGFAWVIEPVSYYATLGVSGTYLSFLTGNIANMCLPSAAAAQQVIGADPGTRKGEVAATLAIAAASFMNIAVLIPVILAGSYILSVIPESVQAAFTYIIPAIFGGMIAQLAMKKPLFGVIGIAFGILMAQLPIPVFFKGLVCMFLTVIICVLLENYQTSKTTTEGEMIHE